MQVRRGDRYGREHERQLGGRHQGHRLANQLRSPFRTAETFWVEEIIDPRETRPLLCDFARMADALRRPVPSRLQMRP